MLITEVLDTDTGRTVLKCNDSLGVTANGKCLFDACYLQHIPESEVRYTDFKSHLYDFEFGDIQVYPPHKMYACPPGWNTGGWSHMLTLMSIVLEARSQGHQTILVMEDDYNCGIDFSILVREKMMHLPEDWHIASFYLAGHRSLTEIPYYENTHWRRIGCQNGQQCVAYNIDRLDSQSPFLRLMYPEFWIQHISTDKSSPFLMDVSYTKHAREVGLNWYSVHENVGGTSRLPSDIFNMSGVQEKRM